MKALLIVDAALLALAGTLAMVLGVVLILYGFHTDLSTSVAAEMPMLATVMGWFAGLSVVLGLAFWSLLRGFAWRWWAQGVATVCVIVGSMYLYRVLTLA
jgi:hypothetical protein